MMRAAGRDRLDDLLDGGVGALGELGDGGRASELAGHRLAQRVEAQRQLLQLAWDAHRPAEVTEIPLELAEDRGVGERGELESTRGIEAVDGLQQRERRDLLEVVEFGAAAIAAREVAREREI